MFSGIDELEKLSDTTRKHVQKLVYTNVVDRFDCLIDKLLVDNCGEEFLVEKVFSGNDQPITESDLIGILQNSHDLQPGEILQESLLHGGSWYLKVPISEAASSPLQSRLLAALGDMIV